MSLALLFHYLLLNMFRIYIHPQELATSLLSYCMGCIVLVRLCVGVTLWWCGIRVQADGYHTTPAKPHRNTNTHRTRSIQPMK